VDLNKVGVVYVGEGQTLEKDILGNPCGSVAYSNFLQGLGELIRLKGTDRYTGGLDRSNDFDGKYAYHWKDDVTQVIFHAATLMPIRTDVDPLHNFKKRHIGNDFCTIVYNDSGLPYNFDTLASQFNFAQIIVTPLNRLQHAKYINLAQSSQDTPYVQVITKFRSNVPPIGASVEPKIVTADVAPAFVRQIAIHANIYSQVFLQASEKHHEYSNGWKDRLRQIKKIKERAYADPIPTDRTNFSLYS
jgi:hypothetical protein